MELLKPQQQKAQLFSTYHSYKLFFDKLRYRLIEYIIEEFEASGFVLATALFVGCLALGNYFLEQVEKNTYIFMVALLLILLRLTINKSFVVAVVAIGFFYPWFAQHMPWQENNTQSLEYRNVTSVDARVMYISLKVEKNSSLGRRIGLTLLAPSSGLPKGQLIRLNISADNLGNAQIGDRVRLKASLMPLSRALVTNEFSYRNYFASKGISAVGRALSTIEIISSTANNELFDGFFLAKLRYKLAQTIYHYLPDNPSAAGVAVALVTGVRDGIPPHIKENIKRSGLAHLLAISGLHIGMIAAFMLTIGSFLWACSIRLSARYDARLYVGVFSVIVALLYALLSGYNIPAQRSFIMLFTVLIALFLGRAKLSRHTLAVAVWIILLLNPNALNSASFQLSFIATLAIVAFYQDILNGESFLLRQGMFQRPLLIKHYPSQLLLCSLLATISTMPFVLYHFDYFSLMGIVANFVGITLVSIVILPLSLLAAFAEYSLGGFGVQSGESLILSWIWQIVAGSIDVLLLTAKQTSIWSEDYSIESGSVVNIAYVLMGVGVVVVGVLRTKLRWFGVVIWLIGVGIGVTFERSLPLVVVSPEKGTIAIIDDKAKRLIVSYDRNTFVTEYWRQHFGLESITILSDGYDEISNGGQTFDLRCEEGRCSLSKQHDNLNRDNLNGIRGIFLGYQNKASCADINADINTVNAQNWCVFPDRVELDHCDDTNKNTVDMIWLRCHGATSLFWGGNDFIERVVSKIRD